MKALQDMTPTLRILIIALVFLAGEVAACRSQEPDADPIVLPELIPETLSVDQVGILLARSGGAEELGNAYLWLRSLATEDQLRQLLSSESASLSMQAAWELLRFPASSGVAEEAR